MKLGAFNLLVALAIVLGIAACGENADPTTTVIATAHKQTAPPSDSTVAESISRLMEFYDRNEQFSGTILVAQDGDIIYEDAFGWANRETIARQIAAIINGLEYESPKLSAASVVGRAVLESGPDVASTTMSDCYENASDMHRFAVEEFLPVANRLAELKEYDGACQVLKSYVRYFSETTEIRQKLGEYCE